MEWVETTGKSIEEAKEAALDELGVDEQDAEFEVLEEPKLGLFGHVRREGRVRARVRPTAPRPKDDRRARRRRSVRASVPDRTDTSAPAATDPPDGPSGPRDDGDDVTARTATAGAGEPTPSGAPGERSTATAPSTRRAAGSASPSAVQPRRNRRRRSGRGRSTGPGEMATAGPDDQPLGAAEQRSGPTSTVTPSTDEADTGRRPAAVDRDLEPPEGEDEHLMDVALEEQGEIGKQFLTGLLDAFGVEATIDVVVSEADDHVDLRVEGDNLGLLIGPKGATLLAIQDLTRTVVQHRTDARNGRLTVDVAGYHERRAAALAGFAAKIAADVIASGEPVALEPMTAADRKVVHDAVNDISGVETRSVGLDDRRHVVIVPEGYEPGAAEEAG